MNRLPTVTWRGSAWGLPLSVRSADLLAALFVDRAAGQGTLADAEWAALEVGSALAHDPPLLMFAALQRVCADPSLGGESLELSSLAQWFVMAAEGLWRAPDSNKSPQVGDPSAHQQAYASLFAESLSRPIDQWMEQAPRWLELAGPPVPEPWRSQWPIIVDDTGEFEAQAEDEPDPLYGQSRVDLWRLARLSRDAGMLSERFASRLHLEKMASLRQLAYGLSHEINNPLANIRTRAEHMIEGEVDGTRRDRLQRIVDQAMRAHEMIADLMYFARPPEPALAVFDAVQLTQRVVEEFRADASGQGIELSMDVRGARRGPGRTDVAPRIRVVGDSVQLADALRAVLRNAIQAIGQRGAVEVQVGRRGRRLLWIVADSGPGLSDEARRHAFDPYYSGREAGRGLGLGLCRVYRVARAHGGGVTIDGSAVGCRVRMWVRADHSIS